MRKLGYLLVFLLALAACKQPLVKYESEITKVALARVGAWSDPGAVIEIDSSLKFKYYGKLAGSNSNYYTGYISRDLWANITHKLELVRYKSVRITDNIHAADVAVYDMVVFWKNHKRKILRVDMMQSDSVLNVMRLIDSTYKRVKLSPAKQPLKLEITLPTISPVQFRNVRFLPPKIKP